MQNSLTPIGVFHSCFKEKFTIPRQPGLIRESVGTIELFSPYNREEWIRGILNYSHVWVLFLFHRNMGKDLSPLVRPPRLGGNKKIGVFASRSGFRPNLIGFSAVELDTIKKEKKGIGLVVKGADILDQTPIIDIKPYLPYADSINSARADIAPTAPEALFSVCFSSDVETFIKENIEERYPEFKRVLSQLLAMDHRPAYYKKREKKKVFGMYLYDFNIRWRVEDEVITVTRIERIETL